MSASCSASRFSSQALVHTDDAIRTEWARVRQEALAKGQPMSQSDTWIAATARALEVLLVSHNRRDFDFLDGLRLISRGA